MPTSKDDFLRQIEILVHGEPPLRLSPGIGTSDSPTDRIPGRSLQFEAMRWTYILRSRERWLRDDTGRREHENEATQTLLHFGLDKEDIKRLGATMHPIVVRMPYSREETGWEGRIFPWEYVIASATRQYRMANGSTENNPITVMRELYPTTRRHWLPKPQRKLLFVQSAPADLSDWWNFGDELERIKRGLGPDVACETLENPTPSTLRQKILQMEPDMIHLSGFDNAQGIKELHRLPGNRMAVDIYRDNQFQAVPLETLLVDELGLPDGYLMTSEREHNLTLPCIVPVKELARILQAGRRDAAFLVSLNLANSAARTAPLILAEGGAIAAIGFQDLIDDALTEYFFERLYSHLRESNWNLPTAFNYAWLHARKEPDKVSATGITLWASAPLQGESLPTAEQLANADGYAQHIQEALRFEIVPVKEMNYAVLHNNGDLFEKFIIERGLAKPDQLITVTVNVSLASESASFSRQFRANEERWNLTREIHVPLTASIARSVRETIGSSIYVEVRLDKKILYKDSHRMRLLPVDQWRDNKKDGKWLPSFVLPRDPAIVKTIDLARRYVRVLRDDPIAGFEGYQVAPAAEESQLAEVDLQVQAIWATLVHEWQLSYINPPPTYSEKVDSQRLRTPSGIVDSRSGTCIDLALMFAACLELIDVYPVIFLLHGHALPGYWRHHSYQDDFQNVRVKNTDSFILADQERSSVSGAQNEAWQAGTGAYRDITQRIRARQLVPIETVRMTENCGFVEAIEAGISALSHKADFFSMLDVVSARTHLVTPLPVSGTIS